MDDPQPAMPDSQSIQGVRTGDPQEPAQRAPILASQTLTDWAPILDALTLPQRRYLAAIQAGASPLQALLRASGGVPNHGHGISSATIQQWLHSSPSFARAYDTIQAGLAVMGVPQARELAVVDMPDLVGHWSRKAREAERDRDQVAFGRLLGEAAEMLGQGARVAVQVNTTFTVPMNPGTAPGRHTVEPQSDDTPPASTPSDA